MTELLRKRGIREATLYNWRAKCGGMTVSEAKRLKKLEIDEFNKSLAGILIHRSFLALLAEGFGK